MKRRAAAELGLQRGGRQAQPSDGEKRLTKCEVDGFYWTDLAPDIVNLGREGQGSI